jgi:hypothetical protein
MSTAERRHRNGIRNGDDGRISGRRTFGHFVNADLAQYHVPVHCDIPEIDILWTPEQDEVVNPIGVKGLGYVGKTGVAAAVANAVFYATGKRIRNLPSPLTKFCEFLDLAISLLLSPSPKRRSGDLES